MAITQLETVAYVVKEESIALVEDGIRPNTLVIEPQEPYPGYHGLFSPNARRRVPGDIFLITKKRYVAEQISHITRKVKKNCGVKFDGARADLYFFNDTYPAIRLRGLASYEQIKVVQDWFVDFNVPFLKKTKIDSKAVIKIQKMLNAEIVEEGLYQDLDSPSLRYFEIPDEITWQQFVSVTSKIKHNTEAHNYDAALGGIFRRDGLVDVIRIYNSKESTLDELKKIRETYINEINKVL